MNTKLFFVQVRTFKTQNYGSKHDKLIVHYLYSMHHMYIICQYCTMHHINICACNYTLWLITPQFTMQI
uniref:Uncharacterized protein n=1 Tax=Anguilla anguilla TaxID=7936 RepID=A0A0E9V7L7_ANGAN